MAMRVIDSKWKLGAGLAVAALVGAVAGAHAQAPVSKLKKILVLDKSQGGANGHKESRVDLNKALAELGTEHGFTVTTIGQNDPASKITTEFSATSLATYQAVLFSNNDGVDAQLDAGSKANLEAYVKAGGALIPIHAASAFIGNWPWLTSMLVQSFYGPHGSNQPTANVSHDAEGLKDATETKGIFKGLTAPAAFLDEYYSFQKSPRGSANVTILLTIDEKSFNKTVNGPMGSDHPVVWAKTEGKGRVIHNSMGHSWSTNNVYTAKDSYLKKFLYGTLRYGAGDFIGCTTANDKNFNPDATKHDAAACAGTVSIRIAAGQAGKFAVSAGNEGIGVHFSVPGTHEVSIVDVAGKIVDRRIGSGPAQYNLASPKKPGIYLVKAKAGKESGVQRITVL